MGGPPCQAFSIIKRLNPRCGEKHGNMIPEFERCIGAARPSWFVMENVEGAPLPDVPGYRVQSQVIQDCWVGGATSRERRFSFGSYNADRFHIETLALHRPDPEYPVLAHANLRDQPIRIGGSGKRKKRRHHRDKDLKGFAAGCVAQGLSPGFLSEAPFTAAGKVKCIGNGVPLPMGRAVAQAVKRATAAQQRAA